MLSLPAQVPIYLCTLPTDMRRGFDGLLAQAQQHLERDPLTGGLYVFLNRRRDRVKLLWWDGDGLAVWYKRLESGTFEMPRVDAQSHCAVLGATELALLLGGIELSSVRRRKRYTQVAQAAPGP
jgi:transposase